MTTNLAARLAAQAGDGEVVCSARARRRAVPRGCPWKTSATRELKNVDEPVRVFRLRPPRREARAGAVPQPDAAIDGKIRGS